MGKFKILKNNKKSQFMIIALIVCSFLILIYTILLSISPIISKNNILTINDAILQENYQNILSMFLYNGKSWIVNPNIFLICYLPMSLSLLAIIFLTSRLITYYIGYKIKNKNGISRIVRPIRSYQITIIFVWVFLILLTLTTFLSLLSASPFFMGVSLQFSISNFIEIDEAITIKIVNQLEGQFGQIYWFSYGWFSNLQGVNNPQEVYKIIDKIMWFMMPFIIQFLALFLGFIGAIFGECSWWTINIAVLKAFDLQTGTSLADQYVKVKKPKINEKNLIDKSIYKDDIKIKNSEISKNLETNDFKTAEIAKNITNWEAKREFESMNTINNFEENKTSEIQQNQQSLETKPYENIKEVKKNYNEIDLSQDKTFDPLVETKCILFYKKLIKMLEIADNTDTQLYLNVVEKLKIIKDSQYNDWLTISNEIQKEINFFTAVDLELVNLIENLILTSNNNFFARYKSDLEELIEDYYFALKTWDLFQAEVKLEQILAIAFTKKELLPKIGFCLKNKVLNNFENINKKTNVINRLESAKNNKDFNSYRDICIEIIKAISPIKSIISNYINKIIYN
ncbi:hypothetical protein [Spiroplasma cantharicola]|uniref:Transmembrane protein n=1 Tax=Spiroplasma cantharicola TaxID=362837 RepID=A0A0M4JWR6_9MOLU|nr:hypothetical protein [Spiroplasma cantharicola]ALD66442.1 hypothetical protein SCANT_v1c05360 [Spiroplasma cantharicola]